MSEPLRALAEALRAEGGLVGQAVVEPEGAADGSLGEAVAARGPEYSVLVEAIREGELLHYGQGRVVRPVDPDLALLAGDRLYALGLARLAELGDLEAVGVLADVISTCAQSHAEGDLAAARSAWEAGVRAIGAGG